jgi:hypothetical protein
VAHATAPPPTPPGSAAPPVYYYEAASRATTWTRPSGPHDVVVPQADIDALAARVGFAGGAN